MNPELANRLLRECRWDDDVARYATEANCPKCGNKMDKGQRTGLRNDWYWYCSDIECNKKYGGGWRCNCRPDPPKDEEVTA